MHNWASILDYKRDSMDQAINVETTLKARRHDPRHEHSMHGS